MPLLQTRFYLSCLGKTLSLKLCPATHFFSPSNFRTAVMDSSMCIAHVPLQEPKWGNLSTFLPSELALKYGVISVSETVLNYSTQPRGDRSQWISALAFHSLIDIFSSFPGGPQWGWALVAHSANEFNNATFIDFSLSCLTLFPFSLCFLISPPK